MFSKRALSIVALGLAAATSCDGANANKQAPSDKADATKKSEATADDKSEGGKKPDVKADAKAADKPATPATDKPADDKPVDDTKDTAKAVDPKTLLGDDGRYDYGKDAFGELTAGLPDKEVVKLLGAPKSKGGRAEEPATGDIAEGWEYPAAGISLWMTSDSMKGPQAAASITVKAPSTLKTKLGIGIGSTRTEVVAAYGKFEDKEEMPSSPESFVAGSIYGGLMFEFKDGKVTQMFMGAGAE